MLDDLDVGFVIGLSAIPFVMNLIFLFGGWLLYNTSSQNRKLKAIEILPDLLEKDHKTVFFRKIDTINKNVKRNLIIIAVINTISLFFIIVYAFVWIPLIEDNINQEQKFDIFVELTRLSIKIISINFVLYGFQLQLTPIIPRAWIALFENENLDTSVLKNSNNRFLKLLRKEGYSSDLLYIHVRTFIRDNYPEKQHYIYKLPKERNNYYNFIQKDKKRPYTGFRGFQQYFQNRKINVLYFSELKMIKARTQTTFHPYSMFGTILFTLGFFSIPYTLVYLESSFLFWLSFLALILGGLIIMYGDFKLIYLNYESLHTILSNYNVESFNNILDTMIILLDKEFPYTKLKTH